MYKIYGIPNCDTVKKARSFLDKNGFPVNFIDFKKFSPSTSDISRWSTAFGGLPVNTKGLTYKKHRDEFEALNDKDKIAFLQKHTSMIKRPILEKDGEVVVFGFDEDSYKKALF